MFDSVSDKEIQIILANLKKLRQLSGLSQEELADKIGISRATLIHIENAENIDVSRELIQVEGKNIKKEQQLVTITNKKGEKKALSWVTVLAIVAVFLLGIAKLAPKFLAAFGIGKNK